MLLQLCGGPTRRPTHCERLLTPGQSLRYGTSGGRCHNSPQRSPGVSKLEMDVKRESVVEQPLSREFVGQAVQRRERLDELRCTGILDAGATQLP
jgi:hypothetical protein